MALTYAELESITNDYFMLDGKKAVNIYFNDSAFIYWFMNKQAGLWERPPGGEHIRVPVAFDHGEGGAYSRADALTSDDRELVNAARFEWKHYYGNATVFKTDELKNAGEYAQVQLVTSKIMGAQNKVRKDLGTDVYAAGADSDDELSGLLSLVSETASGTYGNISEDDLVSADGSKYWEGKTNTDTEALSLAVIRTLRSDAKVSDGKGGKPDFGMTTETLWNKVSGILQVQQRFTEENELTKAGFTALTFEGMKLVADDYCPSGYFFGLNSQHIGWAIHPEGYFAREPWDKLPQQRGKTMKIFWDGNLVCNNRRAHKAHSNLS